MSLWWLSFADNNGFRGGINIEAEDFISAVAKAHRLGISPGGEVRGWQMQEEFRLPDKWKNRLLSLIELSQMGQEVGGDPTLLKVDANNNIEEVILQ